ncbi:MAG: ABC transporter permease [Clostridia bacterium]
MRRVLARLSEHWVRHLIAALQVAIGVAVVAAVFVDVVPVMRSGVESLETEVFSVIYGEIQPFSRTMWSIWTLDDVEFLESQAETVVAASVYEDNSFALVRANGDLFLVRGYAWVSPGFEDVADMRLVAGRFFDDADVQGGEPAVAVISRELAETLFPGGEAVGQVINIRPDDELRQILGWGGPRLVSTEGAPGLDVRVIGVFAYPEGGHPLMGFFAESVRLEILLPATGQYFRALAGLPLAIADDGENQDGLPAGAAIPSGREYAQLYVRVAPGTGQQAVAELEALLTARVEARRGVSAGDGEPDGEQLSVTPAFSGADTMRVAQAATSLILAALGSVALIVSGFSIFTTFLANVAERVRSIGLSRALGATRFRVLREVVGEAAVLAGIGGLIGVALAFPVRFFLLRGLLLRVELPGVVDVVITMAGAVLVAVAIGALAALYPGWTVARMMPAEAFHES